MHSSGAAFDVDLSRCPAPPYAATANMRKFDSLMMNVKTVTSGELALSSPLPVFKAVILLQMEAWQQLPAGSLPNDDLALSRLSSLGPEWPQYKRQCMRGWYLANDNRLYSDDMTQRVLNGLRLQEKEGEEREKERVKKELGRRKIAALKELCKANLVEFDQYDRLSALEDKLRAAGHKFLHVLREIELKYKKEVEDGVSQAQAQKQLQMNFAALAQATPEASTTPSVQATQQVHMDAHDAASKSPSSGVDLATPVAAPLAPAPTEIEAEPAKGTQTAPETGDTPNHENVFSYTNVSREIMKDPISYAKVADEIMETPISYANEIMKDPISCANGASEIIENPISYAKQIMEIPISYTEKARNGISMISSDLVAEKAPKDGEIDTHQSEQPLTDSDQVVHEIGISMIPGDKKITEEDKHSDKSGTNEGKNLEFLAFSRLSLGLSPPMSPHGYIENTSTRSEHTTSFITEPRHEAMGNGALPPSPHPTPALASNPARVRESKPVVEDPASKGGEQGPGTDALGSLPPSPSSLPSAQSPVLRDRKNALKTEKTEPTGKDTMLVPTTTDITQASQPADQTATGVTSAASASVPPDDQAARQPGRPKGARSRARAAAGTPCDPWAYVPPSWVPTQEWNAYLSMRQKTPGKQVRTDETLNMIVKKLADFSNQGYDVAEVLAASVRNGWTDVYTRPEFMSKNPQPVQPRLDSALRPMVPVDTPTTHRPVRMGGMGGAGVSGGGRAGDDVSYRTPVTLPQPAGLMPDWAQPFLEECMGDAARMTDLTRHIEIYTGQGRMPGQIALARYPFVPRDKEVVVTLASLAAAAGQPTGAGSASVAQGKQRT